MSKITASAAFTQMKPEDIPRFLSLFGDDVTDKINGSLDFATNFNCQLLSVVFSAANTDTSTGHTLNRVPAGYIQYGATTAVVVYDGTVASTTSLLTLRCSGTGTVRLLIF